MRAVQWANRSVRTKLVAVVALAFLPVIAVAAWYTITSAAMRASDIATVVDRRGVPLGDAAAAAESLPSPPRLMAAITTARTEFVERGKDGVLRRYHLLLLAGTDSFAVLGRPVPGGLSGLVAGWAVLVVAIAGLLIALFAVWLGSERWCVRPLRYIEDLAQRIIRGDQVDLARPQESREFALIADRVTAMASTLAKREADLRAGLEQRDHLLRELQHRVKNNLQMITSLLNLQAGEIRSPRIRRLFRDAQHRVLTLSILHVHLYERSNWSLVDFQEFIGDIVRQITLSRQDSRAPPLRYRISASALTASPDIAIPVGLIVTEGVNAILDHDFSGVAAPEIGIDMAEKAGIVELAIDSNASGPPPQAGPHLRQSFGMTLLRGLAMQLAGELDISTAENGGGLRFRLVFPMPAPATGPA